VVEAEYLIIKPGEELIEVDGQQFSRSALIAQLERLVGSKHFRNSKRYPIFLRFVVEQTLAGRVDILKERTLGISVFARPSDYDTNADPIVRVTAGEIRKRLAQYYQEPGHEYEIKIELPLGAYVPHFYSVSAAVQMPDASSLGLGSAVPEQQEPADHVSAADRALSDVPATSKVTDSPVRRRMLGFPTVAAICAVVLFGLLTVGWAALRPRLSESALNLMWQPTIASPNPVLIIIGVHSLDSRGHEEQIESHASSTEGESKDMLASMVRSDMVPVSDIVSYSRFTDILTKHSRAYTTVGSADARLEQARNGPVVLIGGFDNLWTLRLTSKLRFRFQERSPSDSDIVDSEHPGTAWRFDNLQKAMVNTQDYAIVASYFDSTIDQPVLIAAGIGKAGTQVAAEFLTNDPELQSWLKGSKLTSRRNVELVLSTEILDGTAGPPHVVASAIW